jgi:predicted ATP-grasp superfamily ATP-dependent carboligase
MRKVLVLDSENKTALSIIRSLGRKNLKIITGGFSKYVPGMLSKYSASKFIYPDPDYNYFIFLKKLKDFIKKEEIFAIFPATDSTSVILSRYKKELEDLGVKLAIENWETFLKTYDKKKTIKIAQKIKIPYPKTYFPNSIEDVIELSNKTSYPIVIKPRSKSFWDKNGALHRTKVTKNNYIQNCDDLIKSYKDFLVENKFFANFQPLLQTYIKGKIMDTVVLAENGNILRYFQNIRLRTFPVEGGAFTLAQGIPKVSKMLLYTKKLMKEIKWTGPAMVEFIKSDDDNEFYLMEINGRYWGSIDLTVRSGVDIPWLHYLQMKGKSLNKKTPKIQKNLRLRWLLPGDIIWLLENLKNKNGKSIGPFISSFFNAKHAIISGDDPLPTLGSIWHMLLLFKDMKLGIRNISGERKTK